MKKLFTLFFLLWSIPGHAKMQGQALIDSLLKELAANYQSKEDTNTVKLLNDLSYSYNNIDPTQGIKYGAQALVLAEKLGWKKGVAVANGILGVNYISRSEYPKALDYLLKSLKINEELGDKKSIAGNLGNIGNIYINQSNYDKALAYYAKALKLFEDLGSQSGIAITMGNIGNTYADLNNYPKALEYSLKALKICEESGNKHGIASNLGNISGVYESQRNYPKALEYDFKAVKIFEELGDKNSLTVTYGNIGECFLKMAQDTGITKTRSEKTITLRKAIDYSNMAITLCKETGDLNYLQTFSQNLSDAQELVGDYKNALENYKQYVTINDSIFGSENKVKILNLEMKREMEIKNKQLEINKLAVAKKRNERVFFIGGICLLLLVIGIVFRNFKLQKKTNKLLSIEKKRSDDLLLNILPSEVADELKATGTAVAKHFDNVTVLFTDFVNFTDAGERMNPQELIDELHTCFKTFDEIIDKYKIEKIKTIGDAYLAVAGLPAADKLHAEHVVEAAVEIRQFMYNRQQQMGDKTFEIRIGIHSGSVVAGIVGVKKFAYDIWGDTVNMASRMEENSKPGKINISQTTYELVRDKFKCTYRGEIQAKNKGVKRMYFVESEDVGAYVS